MKSNRSLTQLKIQQPWQTDSPHNKHTPQSPHYDYPLKNITNLLKNYEQTPPTKLIGSFKHKYTRSQNHFDIPSLKPQPYPHFHTELKPQRFYNNYYQNIETTPFDINKYIKDKQYVIKTLTPVHHCGQQPKRHKILNKQKHANFLDQFKTGKILGKGRFGNVYIAQHNVSHFIVAVKQISLAKVTSKFIQRLKWQIKLQTFINHENCLQLYKFYKQNNNLYLVLQLGQSSLFDKLKQHRLFSQAQAAYYISQTIKALIYLHSNGIVHRDLKPQNIVLINNKVKLADFGWSIYIDQNQKRTTFCGTLDYVSPQIVMGYEYDKMVDVWSIGVLCYQLCTGEAPFDSKRSREETYQKILNVDVRFPAYLSDQVKDFIGKLLIKCPENRMSLEEATLHPWLQKYSNK